MPQTLTIHLARPIASLRLAGADDNGCDRSSDARSREVCRTPVGSPPDAQAIEREKEKLAQSCRLVENLAGKLGDLYDQAVTGHRAEIARLAVEIARKVLAGRIERGDYDLQPVIEEALRRAPAHHELVIRVNPEDLPLCQQWQQDNPNGQFADLNFVADWSVARADCLVETPKGVVKSFVADHLARVADALERAQQP